MPGHSQVELIQLVKFFLWVNECPDRSSATYFLDTVNCSEPHVWNDPPSNDITLYQSDFYHAGQLHGPVAESWNHAVLDSSASKTVCGRVWLQTYVDCFSAEDKSLITYHESSRFFVLAMVGTFSQLQWSTYQPTLEISTSLSTLMLLTKTFLCCFLALQ